MSEQFDNLDTSLNEAILQEIECLDLPFTQKHHIRLLAHCLQVFKELVSTNEYSFPSDEELKIWCNLNASQFEDKAFAELLFSQMSAAKRKLLIFSNQIQKNIVDLEVSDLVLLTNKDWKGYDDPKENI